MSSAEPAPAETVARILVVGASVAGVRTAQALRAAGYDGELTLLGAEPYLPYDKPPLSKELLAPDGTGDAVPLLTPEQLGALDLDLRTGTAAIALDPLRRVVTTDAGEELGYDRLVIATGVVPRTMPGADLPGVHTLRTLADARKLRSALSTARRAVVVGAGFIGAEFTAAARSYDVAVTMLEVQPEPLSHLLGEQVGAALRRLHEGHGVEVVTGARVDGFLGSDRVSGVVADGRVLEAEVVVLGIGASPAVEWLAGSGLPIDDGIACDARLRVVGFPAIYAAGDVARWPHPAYAEPVRVEHWTNAQDHASAIAADVMGRPAPPAGLPYVWSDQYGRRIQIIGRPALGDRAVVRGDALTRDLVALYADADDRLVGAVVADDPRLLMRCRKTILNGLGATAFEQSVLAVAP